MAAKGEAGTFAELGGVAPVGRFRAASSETIRSLRRPPSVSAPMETSKSIPAALATVFPPGCPSPMFGGLSLLGERGSCGGGTAGGRGRGRSSVSERSCGLPMIGQSFDKLEGFRRSLMLGVFAAGHCVVLVAAAGATAACWDAIDVVAEARMVDGGPFVAAASP